MKKYVDKDALQYYTEELTAKYKTLFSGHQVATTAAEMTDTSKIYVYVGSETGYTNGDWYYYDGSAWVSGGVYNAVAVETDTTLAISGKAADAKVVGDALDEVNDALATKAEVDGAYDSMTVGNADQLVASVYTEESTPYNFRTSGGSIDIGDREYDEIVGGTIAWNELLTPSRKASYNSTASWDGRSGSFTATAQNGRVHYLFPIVSGHKYLAVVSVKTTTATTSVRMSWYGATNKNVVSSTNWQEVSAIYSATSTSESWQLQVVDGRSSDWDLVEFKNISLYDLTKMFGSTIADYIYSLEQATSGAGVAWFKKLFPKDYYAYNVGELLSVNVSEHNTVGFNAWDEEWENVFYTSDTGAKNIKYNAVGNKNPIRVIPNTPYYFKIADNSRDRNVAVYEYDINGNWIQRTIVSRTIRNPLTLLSDTHYINFYWETSLTTGVYDGTFCMNLSWDGERDGEYKEYVKHSYALDESLTLRGIPKLDSSNNLYYDGDTYEADGTVTRKYAEYTFTGSETWAFDSTNNYWQCALSGVTSENYGKTVGNQIASNGIVLKLVNNSYVRAYLADNSSLSSESNMNTVFASGVKNVYELATETTEEADSYTNPQIVDDFGTEEYVDYAYTNGDRDVAIPVGHVTQYMPNLKAKLEMAPDSPDGDGEYIVKQTSGENEYIALAGSTLIQSLIARIEALEAQNGGEE